MCQLRNAQVHTAAMVVQAFATVEAGQSPQIWLAAMKNEAIAPQGYKAKHCTEVSLEAV